MKLEIEGKLTSGYYNEMEAGRPIFIDNQVIDEIIKDWLSDNGMNNDFCFNPFENDSHVTNPLKGKKIKFTFEILD